MHTFISRQQLLAAILLFIASPTSSAVSADFQVATLPSSKNVPLFNGRNLQGWQVHTVETGYKNPGVFEVVDGALHIPGGKGDVGYFGGLITVDQYDNYRLRLQYKWGDATYGTRKNKARDAGVLLHCVGPCEPGPWMTSYEFQIIEGGTGDLLLVNTGQGDDAGNPVSLRGTAETKANGKMRYFHPNGELHVFENKGRLNWQFRDPRWKDIVSFRGSRDVESRHGEWTQCEIIAKNDTLEYYVNGVLVNRASQLTITRGKILLQTEGAEVWYRNVELTPLRN